MMVTSETAPLPSPLRGRELPEVTPVGATSDDNQTDPGGPAQPTRSSRTFGRVLVAFGAAGPASLDEPDPIEGSGIEREVIREPGDTIRLRFTDETGLVVARYALAGGDHIDPWYGEYSKPNKAHCYASALEVNPAARGRGIGTLALRVIRRTAAEEFGRGVKHLTARDNLEIRHMSAKVGLVEELLLDGIRLGGAVHWIRRRKVST